MEFRDEILSAGLLERAEVHFAGGDVANNHLNLDRLHEHSDLFERVSTAMAHLILAHSCERPDFLAPIPSGGDIFAETISEKLSVRGNKVPIVQFKKTQDGLFEPRGSYGRDKLSRSKYGVIIDDVSTRLSTLERFLETPGLSDKSLSFCAVWRRGNEDIETKIDIEKYWIVEEYIPSQLPDDSDLWEISGYKKNA